MSRAYNWIARHHPNGIPPPRDLGEVAELLADIAQILDVVKGEWGPSWSDWDQGVRDRITATLRDISTTRVASHD